MSFKDFLQEDLRLVLLRLLKEAPGAANESVLHHGAQSLGHARARRGDIRAELAWLAERGLVREEWVEETVLVARLTERGLDVAEGR